MNPVTLDALLMDRALGELAPETAELLDAYLAQHPAAAARANELDATIGQARRLVSVTPVPLPAPGFLGRASPRRWWRPETPAWMPLAACLALGALLGWAGGTGRQSPPGRSTPAARQPAPARVDSVPGGAAFRVADLHSRGARPEESPRYRLVWKSPVHLSHLEENP